MAIMSMSRWSLRWRTLLLALVPAFLMFVMMLAYHVRVRLQDADERHVARQERDVAGHHAGDDHLGFTGVGNALRRDELDLEGHQAFFSSSFALRNTSSAPPTL